MGKTGQGARDKECRVAPGPEKARKSAHAL